MLCILFIIIMSSKPQQKRIMPDIDDLHPVPDSVVAASSEWKKDMDNKRSNIQYDLDRLRKSRQFRDLGDALDYFSD